MDARLVRPSRKYFAEFQKAVSDHFGRTATARAYIDEMRRAERGLGTGVARSEFWMIAGGHYAGRIQLRHRPSGRHPAIRSHLYYEIAPTKRGRGLGAVLLRLALEKASTMKIDPVLVACDEDNIASLKIIQRCGAVPLRAVKLRGEPGRMLVFAFRGGLPKTARHAA